MSLLPTRLGISSSPADPDVLDIDGDEASEVFEVLGSNTARSLLAALHDDPQTPPELRAVVGTSLQNVHYHLDRLESAELIEAVGTGYSEKGNEMNVYAPTTEALVLFAGDDDDRSKIQAVLERVAGLVVALGLSTVVFAVVTTWLDRRRTEPAQFHTDDLDVEVETVEYTASTTAGMDPIVAFVLGGSIVILLLVIWWVLAPRASRWLRGRAG